MKTRRSILSGFQKKEPHGIVMTGGPCGGKTSTLVFLREKLTARGFHVLVCPEVATTLISGGIDPQIVSKVAFQELVLQTSLRQEETFRTAANYFASKRKRKVVVLYDRGIMDGEAYMDPRWFSRLIRSHDLNRRKICERYDAVMHLQTTAIGAEEFYTLANNSARRESPKEARELDGRTLAAWKKHYHSRLIGNETDFATKKRRVLEEICMVIGHPKPLECERKFVIRKFNLRDITVPYSVSEIYQYYLRPRSTGVECRIRSREDDDGTVFYLTEKVDMGRGMRSEKEIVLSPHEYSRLLCEVDTGMGGIRKVRLCFFWKGRFFEADIFVSHRGLCTVEVECTTLNMDDEIEFPPFLKIIKEVTGKAEYSNSHISRFGIPQD